MATNRKIGNTFETEFCELLFQMGFGVTTWRRTPPDNQQTLSQ